MTRDTSDDEYNAFLDGLGEKADPAAAAVEPESAPDLGPMLPTDPEAIGELLRSSLSFDGNRAEAAAVDLLATVYDGAILAVQRVQRCIRIDGRRVFIHWSALAKEADYWRAHGPNDGFYWRQGIPSPSAAKVIELACLLRKGELTSDELLGVGDAFYTAVTARTKPTPELIRGYLVEFPDLAAPAPVEEEVANVLRVNAQDAALLVRYFEHIRKEIKLSGPGASG